MEIGENSKRVMHACISPCNCLYLSIYLSIYLHSTLLYSYVWTHGQLHALRICVTNILESVEYSLYSTIVSFYPHHPQPRGALIYSYIPTYLPTWYLELHDYR